MFELPTPKPIYAVRHKANMTSVDLNLDTSNNLDFELSNAENVEKDRNKYLYVYEYKETGNLGIVIFQFLLYSFQISPYLISIIPLLYSSNPSYLSSSPYFS